MRAGRYRPFYLARDWESKVLKAGKCQIHGPEPYRPLFTAVEFPSIGFRTSCPSWLADHPIETMSAPEFDASLYVHTFPHVESYFDQVGLDPTHTQAIARELGKKHPAVREGDVIMSTDFVVCVRDGAARRLHAYAVKRAKDLDDRIFEKLAIEQTYWERRDVQWTLLLDTEIPQVRVANMKLVFDFHSRESLPCEDRTASLVATWLTPHAEAQLCALRVLASRCDKILRLEPGTSLSVAYHLVVTHGWDVDWDEPLLPKPRFLAADFVCEDRTDNSPRPVSASNSSTNRQEVSHG